MFAKLPVWLHFTKMNSWQTCSNALVHRYTCSILKAPKRVFGWAVLQVKNDFLPGHLEVIFNCSAQLSEWLLSLLAAFWLEDVYVHEFKIIDIAEQKVVKPYMLYLVGEAGGFLQPVIRTYAFKG